MNLWSCVAIHVLLVMCYWHDVWRFKTSDGNRNYNQCEQTIQSFHKLVTLQLQYIYSGVQKLAALKYACSGNRHFADRRNKSYKVRKREKHLHNNMQLHRVYYENYGPL